MTTRRSAVDVTFSARGNETYHIELWHEGLKKHRVIKSSDEDVVLRKAALQEAEWEERWSRAKEQQAKRLQRDERRAHVDDQKQDAEDRTAAAQRELRQLQSVLSHTLEIDDRIDWEDLKDTSPYAEPSPAKASEPPVPQLMQASAEPQAADFKPEFGFLDRLFASRKRDKLAAAERALSSAHADWSRSRNDIDSQNQAMLAKHASQIAAINRDYEAAMVRWEEGRAAFLRRQQSSNGSIDQQQQRYLAMDPDSITEYCDMVLASSEYPDCLPKEYDLEFNPDNGGLVVEYVLPAVEDVPTLDSVRYVQSRDEMVEKHISNAQHTRLYDSLVYQIALRTIHELFEADVIAALKTIVFNGWVTSTDRSTGQKVTACIMSLQASREEFSQLNLAEIDPKACFKALKGVGSAKLHSLTPVAPIAYLRRDDGRFVSAREVAETLDETANLAAMDWEEFEHLIREIFEREFAVGGGEVKAITYLTHLRRMVHRD